MIIASNDTETTGVDTNLDEPVEVGLAVYDTDINQFLALHSDLYQTSRWGDEAEAVHHIPKSATEKGFTYERNPWDLIKQYKPVVMVAHNAEFDRAIMTKRWPVFGTLPWICTKRDLPHEKIIKSVASTRLQHLAVDYGIDPGQRHRALFDAITCCLVAARHDLESILNRCKEPKFTVKAWYPEKPDFSDKDFNLQKEYLKKAGFRWDGKFWIKEWVPESLVKKYLSLATAKPRWQAAETPMS
jgi:DNA polymerase III epsilon subunit-like protein